MRNTFYTRTSLLVVFVLMTFSLFSQQKIRNLSDVKLVSNEYYLLTLKDKTNILGVYLEKAGDQFVFQVNKLSKLTLHQNDIKYIKKIDEAYIFDGRYIPRNRHSNRYFFGQSAFNIEENDMNITSNMGVQTAIEYGISNHISVSAGANLFSFIDSEFETVNILSAKVAGYQVSKRTTLGVTGFYGINADDRHQMVSGLFTNGDHNHNFTIGLGAYFTNWDDYIYDPSTFSGYVTPATQASALLTFSGMWRVSKSTFLITENWITSYYEHENIFSFGVRFAGSKLAFDAGLMYLSYDENYYPYLGLSYKF
jgi:hypothetical protein